MPPKKSVKAQSLPKATVKEEQEPDAVEEITDSVEDLSIDNREEEEFFNRDSYDAFTKRNGIEILSSNYYVDNDLHKEDVIVATDDRRTSEIMTQSEYTRCVSERAKQIENGSIILITLKNEHEPIAIAEKEIRMKKSPLMIKRYISRNIYEVWSVNEMAIPFGINS